MGLLRSLLPSSSAASGALVTTAPTGALAQTFGRETRIDNVSGPTSGREILTLIYLTAGTLVSNITFFSGTTAATTPTNQWFSLRSSARALLAITADDTTTAWGANTKKTLAVSSPYTVPTSGLYYLGFMVAAAAVPTWLGAFQQHSVIALQPLILTGTDNTNTGLTTPASAPATSAALGVGSTIPYAYVS